MSEVIGREDLTALAAFVAGWGLYQDQIAKVLTPLTPEQLAWRPAPDLRAIGEVATHMIGARARWFHQFLGEGDAELHALAEWDREGQPVRTAGELVAGLNATWRLMRACLARWTAADLAEIIQYPGEDDVLSRQWVIWHLIEHDLHHGGEISYCLGMRGLAAPDL